MKVIGLIFLSAVPMIAGIVRLFGLSTGTETLDHQARFVADPVPGVMHIVCATAFTTLGALQFSPSLRRKRWHRLAGRVLAPFGVLAALSGLWMTWFWPPLPHDGFALNIVRTIVASAMITFIGLAILAVLRRDFTAHGRWMTRGYALGAGAGTQLFTLMPWILLEELRTADGRVILMSAGWIINAVVAEWVIRGGNKKHSVALIVTPRGEVLQ